MRPTKKVSAPKSHAVYIPTDPKLKAIQAGGNWVQGKKSGPKKYSLGKEINDFYAKQRQDKKRETRGDITESLKDAGKR